MKIEDIRAQYKADLAKALAECDAESKAAIRASLRPGADLRACVERAFAATLKKQLMPELMLDEYRIRYGTNIFPDGIIV